MCQTSFFFSRAMTILFFFRYTDASSIRFLNSRKKQLARSDISDKFRVQTRTVSLFSSPAANGYLLFSFFFFGFSAWIEFERDNNEDVVRRVGNTAERTGLDNTLAHTGQGGNR